MPVSAFKLYPEPPYFEGVAAPKYPVAVGDKLKVVVKRVLYEVTVETTEPYVGTEWTSWTGHGVEVQELLLS